MTTVTHSPKCDRPGWETTPTRVMTGVTIARCTGCGALQLKANEKKDGTKNE